MSTLRERLDALTVEATSPDGQIKARLSGDDDLTVAFKPGSFDGYSERALEHQLERLAVLTWVQYRRGYFKALNPDEPLSDKTTTPTHWNAKYRQYHEEVAEMVGQGKAPSELFEVRSKGLAFWKVRIEDGALKQLGEERFIGELLVAFSRVRADSERKRTLLKDKHFGLNLPPGARRNPRPDA